MSVLTEGDWEVVVTIIDENTVDINGTMVTTIIEAIETILRKLRVPKRYKICLRSEVSAWNGGGAEHYLLVGDKKDGDCVDIYRLFSMMASSDRIKINNEKDKEWVIKEIWEGMNKCLKKIKKNHGHVDKYILTKNGYKKVKRR